MAHAFICEYVRTPFGKFAGGLSSTRTDDLAAIPIAALIKQCGHLLLDDIDNVILGCVNQSGEDNRNVARMATLLSGLPIITPASTINRLCGSGMDAIIIAARAIKSGEADLIIAGGVEGMSRSPLVMPKADTPFSRKAEIYDTTIGWRFINPRISALYGTDSMPITAENIAEEFDISREDQDKFALRSQQKTSAAIRSGRLAKEICPVRVKRRKMDDLIIETDEHPRASTTLEKLSQLPAPFKDGGTVTAGNASGINDGACALIIASERAIEKFNLKPKARIIGGNYAGLEPRIMGYGPVPAIQKLNERYDLKLSDYDVIELNEAFAAQSLAVMRSLGLADDAPYINPNGGAIALGHPLGASGARITGTAAIEVAEGRAKRALASMCIGVGQGIAIALEAL